MNKVTYLDHSGFMVQTSDVIMVFDYYRDPARNVVKTLEHNQETPVVFFFSHNHHDHFNHEVFNLGQNHKRLYVISNDIIDREDNLDVPINWMSPGDTIEKQIGGIKVTAYGTTGNGCSYVVTTSDGKKVFHAGELGEPLSHNDDAPRDIAKFNSKFIHAVNRLSSEQASLDLAMMAVDTVEGPDFAKKTSELLEKINVATFVPYHTDDPSDKACNFTAYPFTKNVSTRMICLTRPGESAEF